MPQGFEADRPKTALVAGGTGALGREVVEQLLGRGERVCVPWVDAEEAKQLRSQHATAVDADELRLSECDVTDPDQLAELLGQVQADWGPIWSACSLVGGWAGGQRLEDLDDLGVLDRMLTLNVRSAFVVAREGLRHMGDHGGRVVLVGASTAWRPAAGQAAYTASKAAVMSLAGTLGRELRGSGRTANAVVPTIIDTPANREAMPDADHDRWPPPSEVARVIAWLSSAESWTVNGATIAVPGDV